MKTTNIFEWTKAIKSKDETFIPSKEHRTIGSKYVVVGNHYHFKLNTIITLLEDDSSNCPEFENEMSIRHVSWCKLIPYKWRSSD